MWWPGVVVKKGVQNDMYDHEWISMDRIRDEFRA